MPSSLPPPGGQVGLKLSINNKNSRIDDKFVPLTRNNIRKLLKNNGIDVSHISLCFQLDMMMGNTKDITNRLSRVLEEAVRTGYIACSHDEKSSMTPVSIGYSRRRSYYSRHVNSCSASFATSRNKVGFI